MLSFKITPTLALDAYLGIATVVCGLASALTQSPLYFTSGMLMAVALILRGMENDNGVIDTTVYADNALEFNSNMRTLSLEGYHIERKARSGASAFAVVNSGTGDVLVSANTIPTVAVLAVALMQDNFS